jgi:type VI protein secretion system component VasK
MNLAQAIFVIIGGAAAALTVIGTYTWWVYRRGQDSGRAKAEREANQKAQADAAEKVRTLEAQLTAIQAELDSQRPKRRRA